MKKLASFILIAIMLLSVLPMNVSALQKIPEIDAPYGVAFSEPVRVGEESYSAIYMYYLASNELTEFTSADYEKLSEVYGINPLETVLALEVDYSVNSKDNWQYSDETGKWSDKAFAPFTNLGTSETLRRVEIFTADENSAADGYKKYITTSEGGMKQVDTANNTFYVRARFHFSFTDMNGKKTEHYSEWSKTAAFGKGIDSAVKTPDELEAPVISDIEAYNPVETETTVCFTPTLPESVKEASSAFALSDNRIIPQAEYRVDDGEWKKITNLDTNYIPCSRLLTVIPEFVNLKTSALSVRYRFCTQDDGKTLSSDWSNVLYIGNENVLESLTESESDSDKDSGSEKGTLSKKTVIIIAAVAAAVIIAVIVIILVSKKKSSKKKESDNAAKESTGDSDSEKQDTE